MRRYANVLRCKVLASLLLMFLGLLITSSAGISNFPLERKHRPRGASMHKVLLTQRGYIQFLRWELPVPEIKEFTFCLWLKSNNLTHPHSIFSYSKDERERLIRAWIGPHGRSVHLEIDGKEIFATRSSIRENRWYHICQSWENRAGRYALWINGRVKAQGHSEETANHAAPSGGDIVLGQEYTDFDKGLEEGIEGAVLGFNLLLASSFGPPVFEDRVDAPQRTIAGLSAPAYFANTPFTARVPMKILRHDVEYDVKMPVATVPISIIRRSDEDDERIRVMFSKANEKVPQGRSSSSSLLVSESSMDLLKTPTRRSDVSRVLLIQDPTESPVERSRGRGDPLGLQLVKLSYVRCEIGRGSPFIGGPLMLISWTRTPVRVFGGATLKNVKPDCGNF